MAALTRRQLNWLGCGLGVGYGLCMRLVFGLGQAGEAFGVMTSSFIYGVPFALGFVTVWFGEYRAGYGWARRVLAPWHASLICLGCCLAFAWEGLICVVLWLPLVLVLSSLGGLTAGALRGVFPTDRGQVRCLALAALVPFLGALPESRWPSPTELREVHNHLEIRAAPATVWREIRSVPRIREEEHAFAWVHFLGFPRPVEAVLEGEGVGAVRQARFERGVRFVERITEWQENRRLSFGIQADTAHIPPATFDEHVTIGGPYFDVLEGTYRIEELGPDRVVLHLSSRQRLSTRFNAYSHLWTEALMSDLQAYILRIIRNRCERPTAAPSGN